MKRKAEGSNGYEGTGKKRAMTNGHGVPVKPEDYWPASQDNDENKIEEVPSTTKAPINDEKEDTKIFAKAKVKHNDVEKVEIEDSDTEEEEEISLTAPSPIEKATLSSSAKNAKVVNTSSPEKDLKVNLSSPRKDSIPSPSKDTSKSNKEASPIKETIVPIKAVTSTKRDRFGRSDF